MNNEDKEYYVNFGPELLTLLGPNLYTNIYYVLGEIIANAYDANAKNVYILYNREKDSITIEDDGNGMSYDDFNTKYLPIGVTTRTDNDDIYTDSTKTRKKMGRKGIGKLAALSVSEKVKVCSVKNGIKSGCVLSLEISKSKNGKYLIPALKDSEIIFQKIIPQNGSAIIMEQAKYKINKAIESAKKNISLIFPFTNDEFQIHLIDLLSNNTVTIKDFTFEVVGLSDTLITFADQDSPLSKRFDLLHSLFKKDRYYDEIRENIPKESLPKQKILNQKKPSIRTKLTLKTINGSEKDFDLVISGWIATYASTKDKKRDSDFSPSHISIISNGKLGQFDILPEISTDRMGESYVVGQFYVDLLEETELPDIASSNRQGYKEDDDRYRNTLELIKKHALRVILELKGDATSEKNYLREKAKEEALCNSKKEYDKVIYKLLDTPEVPDSLKKSPSFKSELEKAYELKDTLKRGYKKLMISHNSEDKDLINEFEKVLHQCGFDKNEILYTSSQYAESRIQAYANLFEYLKDFFVNTVFHSDLCVVYVINSNFIKKWNPTLEAGAGWVVNSKWFPMYTDTHKSIMQPFPTTNNFPKLNFHMNGINIDMLAQAVEQILQCTGKKVQTIPFITEIIKSTKLSL
ncbi:MAG: ATP-binding protein [Candidatus Omnitrophota bacterium]